MFPLIENFCGVNSFVCHTRAVIGRGVSKWVFVSLGPFLDISAELVGFRCKTMNEWMGGLEMWPFIHEYVGLPTGYL